LPEQDDDEPFAAFARRSGQIAAWAAVADAASTAVRRALGRAHGVSLPKPTKAHAKMVVRTESAIARNRHAAKVVDRRNDRLSRPAQRPVPGDWVMYVLDARLGKTDQPCHDVNRKYATAEWARRHPVEHPNCTRKTKPMRLPQGGRVTLLA